MRDARARGRRNPLEIGRALAEGGSLSHSTNVVNIDLFQFLSARRTARTIVDHNVHAISEQIQVANLDAFNGQMRPFTKIGDQFGAAIWTQQIETVVADQA